MFIQVVGSGCSYSHGADSGESKEVCLWLGVRHTHKKALGIFSREIAPAGTGMGNYFTCTIDVWAFKGTATGYISHVPQ